MQNDEYKLDIKEESKDWGLIDPTGRKIKRPIVFIHPAFQGLTYDFDSAENARQHNALAPFDIQSEQDLDNKTKARQVVAGLYSFVNNAGPTEEKEQKPSLDTIYESPSSLDFPLEGEISLCLGDGHSYNETATAQWLRARNRAPGNQAIITDSQIKKDHIAEKIRSLYLENKIISKDVFREVLKREFDGYQEPEQLPVPAKQISCKDRIARAIPPATFICSAIRFWLDGYRYYGTSSSSLSAAFIANSVIMIGDCLIIDHSIKFIRSERFKVFWLGFNGNEKTKLGFWVGLYLISNAMRINFVPGMWLKGLYSLSAVFYAFPSTVAYSLLIKLLLKGRYEEQGPPVSEERRDFLRGCALSFALYWLLSSPYFDNPRWLLISMPSSLPRIVLPLLQRANISLQPATPSAPPSGCLSHRQRLVFAFLAAIAMMYLVHALGEGNLSVAFAGINIFIFNLLSWATDSALPAPTTASTLRYRLSATPPYLVMANNNELKSVSRDVSRDPLLTQEEDIELAYTSMS